MSAEFDTLGEQITPPTPAGGGVPASFDTGIVTQIIDATHVKVNLGDKEVTVTVPATLAGAPVLDAAVRVSTQENTYALDSVISGAGAGGLPVGSITMWATATAPTGWLKLDGSTFDANTYPVLAAVLGTTTLPNMANRFPIGVGSNAVKSTGGAASITLTEAQLASHEHGMSHTHGMNHTHTMAHTHNMQHGHELVMHIFNGTPNSVTRYGLPYQSGNGFNGNMSGSFETSDNFVGATNPTNTGGSSAANTGGASSTNTGTSSSSATDTAGSGSAINIQNPFLALNFIIKAA
jgi:microcystin-dependent protein